jgi:hypothetical protein
MQRRQLVLIATSIVLAACVGVAQAQNTQRVRGVVSAIDGQTLSVKTADEQTHRITLTENYMVQVMSTIELAAITPGSFVGVGAQKQADGSQVAKQVIVFPEEARGRNEGHRAWSTVPEGTMTNATVEATVEGTRGRELLLTYKGGKQTISVPPGLPIYTFASADRSLLKPGAKVSLMATSGADGTLSTSSVRISKGGLEPPP